MTDKLQQLLNTPNMTVDQVTDLLKRDGLNCRDSTTYDTPLIVATRNNNVAIVEHILTSVKNPAEKLNIINSTNKRGETALSLSIAKNNKQIALRLLQNGASPLIHASPEILQWLKPFVEYEEFKELGYFDDNVILQRGLCATEIGNRYYSELGDTAEAIKWFDLAANDGVQQAMLNLAILYQREGRELSKAAFWLRKSYTDTIEESSRDLIVTQLKNILTVDSEESETRYFVNMSLGYVLAKAGNIPHALFYFKQAEDIDDSGTLRKAEDNLLFKACSLWNGTSYEKQIPAADFLDITKRFEWLIEANSEESLALLVGITLFAETPVFQLVAIHLANGQHLLNETQQAPFYLEKNKVYVQVLSVLYGWNDYPKNTLRAAAMLKKIIEAKKTSEPDTTALCYLLIAFAYFQQEVEREVYFSEAFHALDAAHECLAQIHSENRAEIVLTMVDCISNVTEDILAVYLETLLNCYYRETSAKNINNMSQIADRILSIVDHLENWLKMIADSLIFCYQNQTDHAVRDSILNFLNYLKETVPVEPEKKLILEQAIAECSSDNVSEQDDLVVESDAEISWDDHANDESIVNNQMNYTDALLSRAEKYLHERKFDDALQNFTQLYETTGSLNALGKIAYIEIELGFYDEAIAHYQELAAHFSEDHFDFNIVDILRGLHMIYHELALRDSRRSLIVELIKLALSHLLSGDVSHLDTFAKLDELEDFLEIADHDPEISDKLLEIRQIITPQELIRIAEEKAEEERQRFYKLLEGGHTRSNEHRLVTLLSLVESEKNNEERLVLIHHAINRWIESVVQIEQGKIHLKNEPALIQLAKENYLLASYYLAKFREQNNLVIVALSLYARIIMLPEYDENDRKIKLQAQRIIENYEKTESRGLRNIFSKQPKYNEYAADLLAVLKMSAVFEDPDIAIQSGLQETAKTIDSYNKYNLSISQLFG